MSLVSRSRPLVHLALVTLTATSLAAPPAHALQESRSPFHAATIAFPSDTSIVRLADIDGDLLEDGIGFYWTNSNKNSVTLAFHRSLGDGSLDVASWPHEGLSTELSVYFQTTPRAFLKSVLTLDAPYGLTSVANRRVIGADFDNDGDGDLLVVPIGTNSRTGHFFWNDGTGLFPETSGQLVDVPSLLVDVDGDGDLDLVGKRVIRNASTDASTAGLRRQYGHAIPGLGSMAPTLGATSASAAGGVLELKLSGAAGGSTALLAIALGEDWAANFPVAGATMLITTPLLIVTVPLSGSLGEAGTGTASLPMALPLGLSGSTFFGQAFVIDAAGTSGTLSHTNGLEIVIP